MATDKRNLPCYSRYAPFKGGLSFKYKGFGYAMFFLYAKCHNVFLKVNGSFATPFACQKG